MTKDKLEQYQNLKNEIRILEAEAARRISKGPDYVSDSVTTAAEFPYSSHTLVISGYESSDGYGQKMQAIYKKRDRLKEGAAAELAELEDYIAGIDDSLIRQIIRLKYIEGLTWQRVAFRIHKHDEQYPRKKLESYLKKYEKYENHDLQ